MSQIDFKAEHNNVVAYRDNGRVSMKRYETTNENRELEILCQWAYQLGRADRRRELQDFIEGLPTEGVARRI